MYLAEADTRTDERAELAPVPLPSDRWQTFPFSQLSHHGNRCCELARRWVLAMDFAQLNGAALESGPRWLRERYKWGPSPWPMHWCDVAERDTIDCGAHAALAQAVFTERGLTALPVQLVQKYSTEATDQWRGSWEAEDVSCHWLDGEHIYHEATGVLLGANELKIWDGSAGSWINPGQPRGYGSPVAVRVFVDEAPSADEELQWGNSRIVPNAWNQLAG
jgi:hypothetical protein